MTITVPLEIEYEDLDISFSIKKDRGVDENAIGDQVFITSVKYRGVEILHQLSEIVLEKISDKILEDTQD